MPDFSFLHKEKKLFKFIQEHGEIQITRKKNVFLALVRAVAGQQLSTKAAASIFSKFLTLCNTNSPTPQIIAQLTIEQLRSVGFSYSKANYIHNIAAFWEDNQLKDSFFTKKSDQEIIEFLTQIKGVGKWTVEMLLMFTLGRENVFAIDDLGIQQGMQLLYNWQDLPLKILKEKMLAKSKLYSPYNTLMCMYIWRYKDNKKNNNS
jgi:DNA-3-methyladenine glycosylase II